MSYTRATGVSTYSIVVLQQNQETDQNYLGECNPRMHSDELIEERKKHPNGG